LRELSKVIQTAVALTKGDVISDEVLLLQHPVNEPGTAEINTAPPGEAVPAAASSLLLEDAIEAHIRYVLTLVRGNKRRAARELGVARATLERRLRRITRDRPASRAVRHKQPMAS
jgi:DNA-binding NtrC family response regulator